VTQQRSIRSNQRIVVGVDGSTTSLEALDWAVDEARLRDAPLEVVHVRFLAERAGKYFADAEAAERSVLDQASERVRSIAPDVEVVTVLADPPTAKFLIDDSRDAQLLVVGSRGLGGFQELTLGSVSQQCVHHAHCPVVVIRRRGAETS